MAEGVRDGTCQEPDMYLADDGTLDTVIACATCGTEVRYTFAGCEDQAHLDDGCDCYAEFVKWALEDAEEHDAS